LWCSNCGAVLAFLSIAANLALEESSNLDDFVEPGTLTKLSFKARSSALSIYESIKLAQSKEGQSILSHIRSILWQLKVYSSLSMG
jgi:hypothetical protein